MQVFGLSTAHLDRWLKRAGNRACAMPIGVEFAPHALHMVQCEDRQERLSIRAATVVPYPCPRGELMEDAQKLRKFVSNALARAPFEGRRVHTCLPPADVRIVPLTVQGSQNTEQATVIRLLKEKLRSDLSQDVFDYLHVRESGVATETNILAVVAARKTVLGHLHMLERAGLEPASVDAGPAALARLLTASGQDDLDHSILLINFGLEKTYITAVSGRRLMLDREVQFGQDAVVARLSSALGVDRNIALSLLAGAGSPGAVAEHDLLANSPVSVIDEVLYPQFAVLAEEVSRTLIYVASKTHGSATRCVYLNGAMAHFPYIQTRVKTLFDVPVAQLDPLALMPPSRPDSVSAGSQPSAGLALAAGLAMRGDA